MVTTTFDHIAGEGISPKGDPFVVAIGIDPNGLRHPLLACSRQVDLSILPGLPKSLSTWLLAGLPALGLVSGTSPFQWPNPTPL